MVELDSSSADPPATSDTSHRTTRPCAGPTLAHRDARCQAPAMRLRSPWVGGLSFPSRRLRDGRGRPRPLQVLPQPASRKQEPDGRQRGQGGCPRPRWGEGRLKWRRGREEIRRSENRRVSPQEKEPRPGLGVEEGEADVVRAGSRCAQGPGGNESESQRLAFGPWARSVGSWAPDTVVSGLWGCT